MRITARIRGVPYHRRAAARAAAMVSTDDASIAALVTAAHCVAKYYRISGVSDKATTIQRAVRRRTEHRTAQCDGRALRGLLRLRRLGLSAGPLARGAVVLVLLVDLPPVRLLRLARRVEV